MSAAVPPFAEFFRAVTGHEPYLWQVEVAEKLRHGSPLHAVDVPTGLGKTGIVYAWCWALAAQLAENDDVPEFRRTVPLRLHMVVDRRVVVDDTYDTACGLARELARASDGPVARVADALGLLRVRDRRSACQHGEPLAVRALRGGLDVPAEHVRSVTTPTVAVGTVDMVMSRVLWRGYGISVGRRPLDAALVGIDSMIVLDEAHLAPQTVRTLGVLTRPDRAAALAVGDEVPRLQVVVMSATLPTGGNGETVHFDRDREVADNPGLGARLARRAAITIATLQEPLSAAQVLERCPTQQGRCLVVFCNTAARARQLHDELLKRGSSPGANVVLLHGGMPRPVARQRVQAVEAFRTGADTAGRAAQPPTILVTTQTLEVGADLDFDDAITEPAPLDSLVQRVGRVNRAGARDTATVTVTGIAPSRGPRIGPYPTAVVAAVHDRLQQVAAVGELDALVADIRSGDAGGMVVRPPAVTTIDAPTFLDLTVTEGLSGEDPVAAWIRVPEDDRRVDVVVRDGIEHLDRAMLDGYLDVFPVRRGEAWSVTVGVAAVLLANRERTVVTMPGAEPVVVDGGTFASSVLRPGATVYVSTGGTRLSRTDREAVATYDGLSEDLSSDADPGCRVLPLIWGPDHGRKPGFVGGVAYVDESFTELVGKEGGPGVDELRLDYLRGLEGERPDWVSGAVTSDASSDTSNLEVRQSGAFWYLTTKKADDREAMDPLRQRRTLAEHSAGVAELAASAARALRLTPTEVETIEVAALRHDWGKVESAFQRQLTSDHRSSSDADMNGAPLAKSGLPRRLWRVAGRAAGVVPGWRHEALSVAISDEVGLPDDVDEPLGRHLIGTHHGHLRGLLDPLDDPRIDGKVTIPPGQLPGVDRPITVSNTLQSEFDPEWWTQFAELTARYGPYRLALLEAVLRFADWDDSREAGEQDAAPVGEDTEDLGDAA